jgi:hypothetical protein
VKHDDADFSGADEPVLDQLLVATGDQASAAPSRVLRALEAARKSAWAALVLVSVLGTYAGVAYWIAQGWTLGVVLSVLIPGFGLISILWSLAA